MNTTIITQFFIRALGAVHFFNFLNLLFQVDRIFTSNGLLPVADYVSRVYELYPDSMIERIITSPGIFLWLPYDWLLISGAFAGVFLAMTIIAGFHSRWCFVITFLLYGSYIAVGQELYSFQWDALILETTFLAILLPSSRFFFNNYNRGGDQLTIWLFNWLLFRLYIESGVAKLFWGPDSWATLQALNHYYETAPIPTWIGYYAHFLPEWWHQLETGVTLIIEILIPALIFGGKWSRRIAFVIFTSFQIGILATANYGIFNYTTLCLHLFLLRDGDLQFVVNRLPFIPAFRSYLPIHTKIPWPKYALAVIIICFSIIEFMMLAGGRKIGQTTIGTIQRYTGATRIASRYHLFGPIDPIRYELIIELQREEGDWIEMNFPYKIDQLSDKPPLVASFHPRVDFRLWFERYPVRWNNAQPPYADVEAAPSVLSGYLKNLVLQCMEKPALGYRYFDKKLDFDPQDVRITYYHYKMEPPDSINYWSRTKVGTVYFLKDLENADQKLRIRNNE